MKDLNKIDQIYEASLRLITREGLAGLTMSKLAKEASLATGTLYIYFKSKEELLNKLYHKLQLESSERFMQGYSQEEDFLKGLKKMWLNYLKHRIENYEKSVFMEQYYRSPYISPREMVMAESLKKPVHQLIRRGKNEGLVRPDLDDEMLFLAMLGFIRELADEHVGGVYKLNPTRIDQAFQLSWVSIKK